MAQFETLSFALPIQPYTQPTLVDIGVGILVAIAAAAIGMVAVWLFPIFHKAYKSMGNVIVAMTVGGFLLGLLGILGGPITMFKGLGEMKQLTAHVSDYSIGAMGAIIVIKLLAILISATCGFRGGRIFPMVFVGVAFGLLVHQLFPSVPAALTVACSVLGFTLVVTRDGWLSMFMGVVMIPGTELLPLLCVAVLPVWLLLAGRPLMLIEPDAEAPPPKGN